MPPTLTVLGAAREVTGSAYLVETGRTRKGKRAGRKPWRSAYTRDDADRAIGLFQRHRYGEELSIGPEVRLRFWDAGHILGSAILELTLLSDRSEDAVVHLVFSGDVGQPERPLIRDPESGMRADYLVLESTYGGRRHEETKDAIEELRGIIKAAKASGGNIIIPSFAVGRTQEIIYYLRQICEEEKCHLPIYVDSPLATEATEVYRRHRDVFDEEAQAMIADNGPIFRFAELHFTESADESRALNGMQGVIIISSSGMAEAGRVKHHLKHNLWRPEAHVVFVGYQAEGSLGRRLLEGEKRVRILGEEIAVKAKIHDISSLSAHADRDQLITWASSFKPTPITILTHGEPN